MFLRKLGAAALVLVLVLVIGSILGWWDWKTLIGWRALVDYINPDDATERKEALQVYAVIVAGLIASITAAVGLANLSLTRKNMEQQRELEAERSQHTAQLERARAQGTALQAYYEQIGKLLTEKDLRFTEEKDVRELARAQTLTLLRELDADRKGSLLAFLHAAGLIETEHRAIFLTFADLMGANLREANLQDADLQDAYLEDADLMGAKVTDNQLLKAQLLKGATMPDGSKHP